MTDKAQTAHLKETYCLHCHLSTRADSERCLHCRKPLNLKTSLQPRALRNGRESDGQTCPAADPA